MTRRHYRAAYQARELGLGGLGRERAAVEAELEQEAVGLADERGPAARRGSP